MLPDSLVEAIQAVEAATDVYDSMTLTIAVAYGGREEITDAVRALLRDKTNTSGGAGDLVDEITPELIGQYMYVPDLPDPDLIIRTSGEIRLSGFLLWQSSHSEFYFSDVHWPAFRKIDFLRERSMTALGQNRKSSVGLGMSGVGGGAEVDFGRLEVRS